jgi:hypothetical protein
MLLTEGLTATAGRWMNAGDYLDRFRNRCGAGRHPC